MAVKLSDSDFSGYATKANVRCTDGLIINPDAFKHMDKMQVPLVWQHGHSKNDNVLGYAMLEHRQDGIYAYGFFNSTPAGTNAKTQVIHGDITAMSIYANAIARQSNNVTHGSIREVSLVLSGANPGAVIDFVNIRHSADDIEVLDDEAVITSGEEFEHAAGDAADPTVQQVYDSLDQVQKDVVNYLIGTAVSEATTAHSDITVDKKPEDKSADPVDNKKTDEGVIAHKEGTIVSRNVFEQGAEKKTGVIDPKSILTHDAMRGILAEAEKSGSLKAATEAFAVQHGLTNLDLLFPDYKTLTNTPEFLQRRVAWVSGVLNGTRHSPFSRIKTVWADITQDSARALGYIKGHYKKEEWFGLTKRTTGPTTIYKKQKLDRDDIIDIADFDVVAWMRAEMRMMLEEEIARAILIGDGRAIDDDDKIKDPMAAADGMGIRSILNEHEVFATTVMVNLDDSNSSYQELIDSVLLARTYYKGSGSPTFYTTNAVLVRMLLLKDGFGRRLYGSVQELASALMVSSIVEVEVMESVSDLLGIIVNLNDYNVGADKGGEVTLFDDFDIDYNQLKWLIETRISGALVKPFSAQVIRKTAAGNVLVDPTVPTFVKLTGVVTIPTKTGVVYKNSDTSATLTAGAQTALTAGSTLNVIAVAASGYYLFTNAADQWSFTRPAA